METIGIDATAEVACFTVKTIEDLVVVGIVDLEEEYELFGDSDEVCYLFLGTEPAAVPVHDVAEVVDTHFSSGEFASSHTQQIADEADVLFLCHCVPAVGDAIDFTFIYKFDIFVHGRRMILSSGLL